jgi:hypothetical protein
MKKTKTLKNHRFFVPRKSLRFSRESQIQIGETISVLAIFFILLVIGFIFYVKVIKSNAAAEAGEMSELRSVEIAQRAMFLPELQCSNEVTDSSNCIDKLKMSAAKNLMQANQAAYHDIFGFASINIIEIYPGGEPFNIYSRTIPDFSNKFPTNVPVSLYDPIKKEYSFGMVSIETYS